MIRREILSILAALSLGVLGSVGAAAQTTPDIVGLSKPVAGQMQMVFHGKNGPFRIQSRSALDASAAWNDVVAAKVTELEGGVFMALLPNLPEVDSNYYRVVNENETIAELKGWTYLVQVSAPANKTHFVAGEAPVITVTILDNFAKGITRDTFSTLNLYMNGPQDPKLTVAALKLLNATGDRTKTPHHYIDLKKNADVKVDGNVITYNLKPITDELPGTYTVAVYAVRGDDLVQQMMKFADVQIGTATAEKLAFEKANCTDCHEGTANKKIYMHHVDVGRSPVGSWSLDYQPERSCKACHNNDGYAAFSDGKGGRTPDHIVIRAHGVHMGEGLASDFNTNSVTGNFRDYLGVVFPSDVRNCTTCHADDRWKTDPTRLACGSCHDNRWFGPKAEMPAGMERHTGGTFVDDDSCSTCHAAEDVADYHEIPVPAPLHTAELALSEPANGKFYTTGDKPIITLKLKDQTGKIINPADVKEPAVSTNIQPNEWNRANLFVTGPRAMAVPVLTTAITNTVSSTPANDVRVRLDAAKEDPMVTRGAEAISYQLADIADLAAGTYTIYVEARQKSSGFSTTAWLNFQVGTTNAETQITPTAGCISCHGETRMHATSRALPFSPDTCYPCHDYKNQMTGKTNWSNSQWGYGVGPLVKKVHGVHYGKYLHKQADLNGGAFAEVIFPQDVRNCTKCHSDPKNTTWNSKPSSLACLACHDSDAAITHAKLMTWDPTPAQPYSGDEEDTCTVCHGASSDLSPAKVHSIANPYVPPYPREPAE